MQGFYGLQMPLFQRLQIRHLFVPRRLNIGRQSLPLIDNTAIPTAFHPIRKFLNRSRDLATHLNCRRCRTGNRFCNNGILETESHVSPAMPPSLTYTGPSFCHCLCNGMVSLIG